MANVLPPGICWVRTESGVKMDRCPPDQVGGGAGEPQSSPNNFVGEPPPGYNSPVEDYERQFDELAPKMSPGTYQPSARVGGGGAQPTAFNQRTGSPNFTGVGFGTGNTGAGALRGNTMQLPMALGWGTPEQRTQEYENFWSGSPNLTMPGGSKAQAFSSGGGSSVADTAGTTTTTQSTYNPLLERLINEVGGTQAPAPGPMPRTLYDKYAGLLMDPSQIAKDPAYQLMLKEALTASTRSLAAGRMRNSGNAAIEAAKIAAGTPEKYLQSLSSIYGQGAGVEAGRYATETGAQSQAYRDLLSRYGAQISGAGNLGTMSQTKTFTPTDTGTSGAAVIPSTPTPPSGMGYNPDYWQPNNVGYSGLAGQVQVANPNYLNPAIGMWTPTIPNPMINTGTFNNWKMF